MITALSLIASAAIGVVTAWLAGQWVRGYGFGFVGNVLAGAAGAVCGGALLNGGGMDLGGWLGRLVVSFLGAVIALLLVHAYTGRRDAKGWS